MHQGQVILNPEPAQKGGGPVVVAVGLKPDLLPVALVLTADGDCLAGAVIQFLEELHQIRRLPGLLA